MLELILVRHGETDSNTRGTYCGWTDCRLNENGLEQAHIAAEKLKGIEFKDVFSSPLKRAKETVKTICEDTQMNVIYDDGLKEQNFGEWEDQTYAEITAKYPEECTRWQSDWMNYCVMGGESPAHVYRRVSNFIDRLINTYESGKVLIVTHLGCIRFIVSHLLGMSMDGFWRFRVDNGSISRIKISDDKFAYLHSLNT